MYSTIMSNFRKPKGFIGGIICSLMNLGHGPMIREVMNQLQIEPQDTVLDVGCGGGLAISYMAERASKVYGIDYSDISVRKAGQKNAPAIQGGKVTIKQTGVADMSFPDHMFDLVTAFETIYFWDDLSAGLKRIYHSLKPGGRLAIVVEAWKDGEKKVNCPGAFDCLNLKLYSREELELLLSGSGFVSIEFIKGQRHKWFMALSEKSLSEPQ